MALRKSSKRAVISDESLNNHGFRTITDGIDISQYERNPLLLWMHQRASQYASQQVLPIGNVIELKFENGQLTGLPCFDDTDPFAMQIYEKWESGVLRMTSPGLKPVVWSDDPKLLVQGQTLPTLTRSILREISIADMGSNDNALQVTLYDDNGVVNLSDGSASIIPQLKTHTNMELKDIAPLLGLAQDALQADVLAAITTLTVDKQTADNKVITLTQELTTLKKEVGDQKVKDLVNDAVTAKKITAGQAPHYEELATLSYDATKKALDAMQPYESLKDDNKDTAELSAEVGELVKLSADELWRSGKLARLKELHAPSYEKKWKELNEKKK